MNRTKLWKKILENLDSKLSNQAENIQNLLLGSQFKNDKLVLINSFARIQWCA